MEKRQVGQTGLTIDTLGLGGAPLGGNFVDLDYAQAADLIQAAKDAGSAILIPLLGMGLEDPSVSWAICCAARNMYFLTKSEDFSTLARSQTRWILV